MGKKMKKEIKQDTDSKMWTPPEGIRKKPKPKPIPSDYGLTDEYKFVPRDRTIDYRAPSGGDAHQDADGAWAFKGMRKKTPDVPSMKTRYRDRVDFEDFTEEDGTPNPEKKEKSLKKRNEMSDYLNRLTRLDKKFIPADKKPKWY